MKKLVSVIIPTYRGDISLERAIKSVLRQDYQELEIIIVDDNGKNTDFQIKTEEIVNKYADKVKYIAHDYNKNGAAARNTGLKVCRGEYICFLDDDDIMLPKRISLCVEKLEQNKKYDAVYTDVVCVDYKLTPTRIIRVREEGNCYKELMLKSMFFGTGSNIFITRKALKEVGLFDESFIRHQDLEYMIRFYRKFSSTYIDNILLVKSKNATNNFPSYKKLNMAKKIYFEKFSPEIHSFNENEKKDFNKLHYRELMMAEDAPEEKYNKKLLSKKERMIFFVNKNHLRSMRCFILLNEVRKIINSISIKKQLDQEVLGYLKKIQ